jgi:hypothetical protein
LADYYQREHGAAAEVEWRGEGKGKEPRGTGFWGMWYVVCTLVVELFDYAHCVHEIWGRGLARKGRGCGKGTRTGGGGGERRERKERGTGSRYGTWVLLGLGRLTAIETCGESMEKGRFRGHEHLRLSMMNHADERGFFSFSFGCVEGK